MIALPAATPVTRPVEVSMVATAGALLVHLPPEMVDAKVEVPFTQISSVPLSVPAVGAAVTVTVCVAVALAQPPVPVTV